MSYTFFLSVNLRTIFQVSTATELQHESNEINSQEESEVNKVLSSPSPRSGNSILSDYLRRCKDHFFSQLGQRSSHFHCHQGDRPYPLLTPFFRTPTSHRAQETVSEVIKHWHGYPRDAIVPGPFGAAGHLGGQSYTSVSHQRVTGTGNSAEHGGEQRRGVGAASP